MKRLLLPVMGKAPSAERAALASMGREIYAVGTAAQRRDGGGRLMAAAVLFEIVTYRRAIRAAMIATAVLVLAVILYICTSHVEEIAVAEGQITPSNAVQTVQHLEGGIVAAILVSEGQKVEAGDVLVQLDNPQEMAALTEVTARYVILLLRRERLSAIMQQREPNFETIGAGYPQLVQEQLRTLTAQRDQQRSALSVLSAQVAQRSQEVTQLRRQLETAQEQAKIVEEQAGYLQKAVEAGVASRQTYLATSRTLSTTRGEVARLTNQITIMQQQLTEAQQRRDNVGHSQVQDASNELADIGAEIQQVRGLVDKEQLDRIARLDIRAPMGGLVQDLKIHSIGEIVPAGGQVSRIVPITEELEGAIRISPNDIGFVKVGQPVRIKVSTYETRQYGVVDATLSKLSAITFNDERGPPYYKGTVKLAGNTIGSGDNSGRLLPGMTFEANIITGSRSLLRYLLAPNAILAPPPPLPAAPAEAEPAP